MYKPLETIEAGDTIIDVRWGMIEVADIKKIDETHYTLTLDDGTTHTVDGYGYKEGDDIRRIIDVVYHRPLLCRHKDAPELDHVEVNQYSNLSPRSEIVGRAER